ncbi:MAG: transglutaminase-like domain-containing protein [Bacteroidia bacterium]|nr:transglutaminase-like domain-containing protein [Bacteroidia bacterium]
MNEIICMDIFVPVRRKKSGKSAHLNEVISLITLLDDPDESIYSEVKKRFLLLGPPVIPHLETAWENTLDALMQKRIEELIHEIHIQSICNQLKEWREKESENLLKGFLIINRYQYQDLDEKPIIEQLEKIRRDIWVELHEDLTALEKVKIVNHILFEVYQFSGNITNYHAPQNSFLNHVLESKKGSPLLLSVVYILVCNKLNIPIYGVNLPQHFVVAYLNDFINLVDFNDKSLSENILFYINPFSKGILFNHREIDEFLKQLNIEPDIRHYLPCDNVSMVVRCVHNLIHSYAKLGYTEKVRELEQFLNALI